VIKSEVNVYLPILSIIKNVEYINPVSTELSFKPSLAGEGWERRN
jgi:hypothetical protein